MRKFPIRSYLPRITSSWGNVAHATNLAMVPPITKNGTEKVR